MRMTIIDLPHISHLLLCPYSHRLDIHPDAVYQYGIIYYYFARKLDFQV